MAEASSREVVELNFSYKLGLDWFPFHRAFCAPATQSPGSFSCKTGWPNDF